MKKIFLTFLTDPQAQLGTPTVPPTGQYQNMNLNALGSLYAQLYGHNITSVIQRATREVIFDSTPKQYLDLKIMSLKTPKMVNSDEYYYNEMGFGRDPIVSTVIGGGGIAAGATQNIPLTSVATVSLDTIIVYFDNTRGTVTAINTGTNTITVTAESGGTLTALPAGSAYTFANLSPVEADGMNTISQYFRQGTIERVNFIQCLIKAQRWGKMELEKHKRAGSLNNYVAMNKQRLYEQFRVDLSNVYWNGNMAEVTLANGMKAKTSGGVFPIMQQNGSPNASVTLSNLPSALEELALDTEFGTYGETRFLYGTNRVIHYLNQQYKRNLTRYTPNDDIAKLGLKGVDIGSSYIVFVPIKRFEEPSCFPSSFRSRLILLDQKNIQPTFFFPEEMGDTLSRVNNGTLQNFVDSWISGTYGMEFYNPLACGWLDVTDLP